MLQSLWRFHRKQERRRSLTCSKNLSKEKNWSITKPGMHYYAAPILFCFSDAFLRFKNVFIDYFCEDNSFIARDKPVVWNWNDKLVQMLWRKTVERLVRSRIFKPQRNPDVFFFVKKKTHTTATLLMWHHEITFHSLKYAIISFEFS